MKKIKKTRRLVRFSTSLFLIAILALQSYTILIPHTAKASLVPNGGLKRVIVQYRGEAVTPKAGTTIDAQAASLTQRVQWLKGQLKDSSGYAKVDTALSQLPIVIMDVDSAGEATLKSNPNVVSVSEDQYLKFSAFPAATTPTVAGGTAAQGFSDGTDHFTGNGQAIAMIDSGVDMNNPLFGGKLVAEGCFGQSGEYTQYTITSGCPGGVDSSTAAGSSNPCTSAADENCWHGTSTAGVALMKATTVTSGSDSADVSGIAKDAKLIALRNPMTITEKAGQSDSCGDANNQTQTCTSNSLSGMIQAMNYVISLANDPSFTTPIAAVNISQGIDTYFSDSAGCAGVNGIAQPFETAATALKQLNIATTVSAGNAGDISGNQDKIASPACSPNAIAVSASTSDHHMTTYSNAGPLTDIVAPGGEVDSNAPYPDGGIVAPILNNAWEANNGTSFSAPVVAGAYAVFREKDPTATVDTILKVFQDTGMSITESRSGYTSMVHKELNLSNALQAASNVPSITALTGPSGSAIAGSSVNLAVTVANAGSCIATPSGGSAGSPVNVSGGSVSIPVTIPSIGNSVTYLVSCASTSNPDYMAQKSVTFAVTGASNPTGGTSSGAGGAASNAWVPGVPNTGAINQIRAYAVIVSCLLGLVFINRRSGLQKRTR